MQRVARCVVDRQRLCTSMPNEPGCPALGVSCSLVNCPSLRWLTLSSLRLQPCVGPILAREKSRSLSIYPVFAHTNMLSGSCFPHPINQCRATIPP